MFIVSCSVYVVVSNMLLLFVSYVMHFVLDVLLRLGIVFVLLADFVDLWMSLAEFFGIIFVWVFWHHPLWVCLVSGSCAAIFHLVQLLLPMTSASSCSCIPTPKSSLSGTISFSSPRDADTCGSGISALKVARLSSDLAWQNLRVDAAASQKLAAERVHRKQDQAWVMRVILGLDFKCCGASDFNFSGTNQTHIRVKCTRCERVCLRLRREGHGAVS